MNSDKYKKFIATIYFWLLQEKIFFEFLNFDSYSFFSILNLFFTESKIIKIIQDFNFSTITSEKLQKLIEEQENNSYFLKDMKNLQNEIIKNTQDIKYDISKSKTVMEIEHPKEFDKKDKEKEKSKIQERKEKYKEQEKKEKEKEKENEKENENEIITESEKKDKEPETENNETEVEEKKENNKNESSNQITEENEEVNPFSNSKTPPQFGKGVKLNDLNSVLLYIIELTESQGGYFSHQDLDTFLIRFASKYQTPSKIPELVRIKIFEGFTNCLKFFSEYRDIRNELINKKEDKFNCHSLSKEKIDINDFYFSEISKCLNELLDSEIYKFNNDELNQLIKVASRTPFTMLKIKIA